MIRKDREIIDNNIIDKIIDSATCIRLGLYDGEMYIVPLNFGFQNIDGKRTFYFHSAKKGKKLDIIKKNNKACFELDTDIFINIQDNPCSSTCYYKSIIGNGMISFIEDPAGKEFALNSILKKYTGEAVSQIKKEARNSVTVFKLDVDSLTCKANIKKLC